MNSVQHVHKSFLWFFLSASCGYNNLFATDKWHKLYYNWSYFRLLPKVNCEGTSQDFIPDHKSDFALLSDNGFWKMIGKILNVFIRVSLCVNPSCDTDGGENDEVCIVLG